MFYIKFEYGVLPKFIFQNSVYFAIDLPVLFLISTAYLKTKMLLKDTAECKEIAGGSN